MFSKVFKPFFIFNLILLFSFSISINTYVDLQIINLIFYIFFHLVFIYILFYHYHYSIFIIGLFYGVLLDLFLLNEIATHLLSLIILITSYILLKKKLFLLTAFQISITIFITLVLILFLEGLFAYSFNNINFTFSQMIKYIVISIIIFFPSIFIFNKLDN